MSNMAEQVAEKEAPKSGALVITKELLKEWEACRDGYSWFIAKFPQGGDVHEVGAALRADKRYDDARWLTNKVFSHFIKEPSAIAGYVDGDVARTIKDVAGSPNSASGYGSTAASSGDYSTAASSGDGSKAASSGDYSKAASSGYGSTAASSGNGSTAASSGDYSTAASSGDYSTAASSGDYSKAASSGDYSKAASSGNGSTAASSGNGSTAASSGYGSTAEAIGEKTVAMVAGRNGKARAGEKGAFALAWLDGERMRIAVGVVGEVGIKADTLYRVGDAGQLEEV